MQNRVFVEPIVANAVHIDTVRLSHAYRANDLPPPDDLIKMNFEVKQKKRGDNRIYTAQLKPYGNESTEPNLFIVISEYGYCGIKTDCSLAKLLNANGLVKQTDEDIECALDAVDGFILQRIEVNFDAQTAKVDRFDVNADFPVGENRIKLYLEATSRPNARLVPSTFGTTTNYYFNKSRTYALYGKKQEMEKLYKKGKVSLADVIAAEGLLRIEDRLKTPQAIKRFANKYSVPAIACELLTKAIASNLISETICQLRLNSPRFSMEARDYLLLKHFGKEAAEMLGILEFRKLLGEDFWKDLDWSRAKYYKKRKELELANLWDVSPAEALPALAVKLEGL